MELDQKIRYGMIALAAASAAVAALGLHAGVHLRVLEGGPGAD